MYSSVETKGTGEGGPLKNRWGSGFGGQIWEIRFAARRPKGPGRGRQWIAADTDSCNRNSQNTFIFEAGKRRRRRNKPTLQWNFNSCLCISSHGDHEVSIQSIRSQKPPLKSEEPNCALAGLPEAFPTVVRSHTSRGVPPGKL